MMVFQNDTGVLGYNRKAQPQPAIYCSTQRACGSNIGDDDGITGSSKKTVDDDDSDDRQRR